jgi:hypothetical protein
MLRRMTYPGCDMLTEPGRPFCRVRRAGEERAGEVESLLAKAAGILERRQPRWPGERLAEALRRTVPV